MNPEVDSGVSDPYRACFKAIEAASKDEKPISPAEAYGMYKGYLQENDLNPLVYTSMAITSGGFSRDGSLSSYEAIAKNSSFGTYVATQIHQHFPELDEQHILTPSALGKVPRWRQSDYLLSAIRKNCLVRSGTIKLNYGHTSFLVKS